MGAAGTFPLRNVSPVAGNPSGTPHWAVSDTSYPLYPPPPSASPYPTPQGGAPDVGVMSPYGASVTNHYSLTTEIGFSAELPAHRGQHQATKEGGAATSTTRLCSEQILRGKRAGCRQKTSELAFSKNTIYSPLLVTAGQGKQVQRRRPCTPGCSVVLYATCLSRGSCRGLALYFAV